MCVGAGAIVIVLVSSYRGTCAVSNELVKSNRLASRTSGFIAGQGSLEANLLKDKAEADELSYGFVCSQAEGATVAIFCCNKYGRRSADSKPQLLTSTAREEEFALSSKLSVNNSCLKAESQSGPPYPVQHTQLSSDRMVCAPAGVSPIFIAFVSCFSSLHCLCSRRF